MANRPINIEGIDPSTGQLILSDNGNTNVDPGDTVTWNILNNSGVASISNIADNSTTDLFSSDPAPQNNNPSASWQGTISNSAARGSEETYTINYTTSSGQPRTHDPKISVNN